MSSNADARLPSPTEALEHLGRLALREHTMQSLLQSVAALAKQVMPGNPETSVLLLVNDKATTVVDGDGRADLAELGEIALERVGHRVEAGDDAAIDVHRPVHTGEHSTCLAVGGLPRFMARGNLASSARRSATPGAASVAAVS